MPTPCRAEAPYNETPLALVGFHCRAEGAATPAVAHPSLPLSLVGKRLRAAGMTSPKSADETSEGALIRRVRAGDQEAFYELVRPHERSLYLTAFSMVRNGADAEDIAQEAVLKAFKNLVRFRQESKFSTWLIQITINEARMRLRKVSRHLEESLEEGSRDPEGDYVPRDFADWREIPSDHLERKRLRQALAGALASLAPKYRSVFVLRDVQHISIAQTARILGLTPASVKTRLLRARLQMRDALAPGLGGNWSSRRQAKGRRAR